MKTKLSIVVSGNKDYFTKEPYAPIKALASLYNNLKNRNITHIYIKSGF
jgi:hypothetical protein